MFADTKKRRVSENTMGEMQKSVVLKPYLTFIRSNETHICSNRREMICDEPMLVGKHGVVKIQT
jgi:hypothetical protein